MEKFYFVRKILFLNKLISFPLQIFNLFNNNIKLRFKHKNLKNIKGFLNLNKNIKIICMSYIYYLL